MSYDDRQFKYIKTGMDFVETVTKRILENLEGDEKQAELENMRKTFIRYIQMEMEYSAGRAVLARLKEKLDNEQALNSLDDIEEKYEKALEEELEAMKEKMEASVLKGHPKYKELEKVISEHSKEKVGDESIVTGVTESFIDPWSKKTIDEPVRNRVCGHLYDKATVTKMITRAKRDAVKCPVVGCGNNHIKKNDLIDDEEVAQKIRRQL